MDTRNGILKAAADVFSQHGFRGSTTRRIAEAAGVNEVTIFRYFGSKDALIQEAISSFSIGAKVTPLPERPEDPVRELTDWCGSVLEHLHSRRSMIRKCMGELEERPEISAGAIASPTRAAAMLTAYFQELCSVGFTSERFDSTAAAAMLMGAVFHDAMGREMMPSLYPPKQQAPRLYAELLLRAIGVTAAAVTPAETATDRNEATT